MKNCIVMGCGRSGTSMVTGTLAKAGYFMGSNLIEPVEGTNPRGFFEDREINRINEDLLAKVAPRRLPIVGNYLCKHIPTDKQRWLSKVKVGTKILTTTSIEERIQTVVKNSPYCLKDPRFSYTLSAWRPFLGDVKFICVFRDPESSVKSIVKECQSRPYLRNLKITPSHALKVWMLMYRYILEIHSLNGDWLFLHFDQVLTKQGLDLIEEFTGAQVDRDFPEKRLRNQFPESSASLEATKIYQALFERTSIELQTYV